MRPAKIDIYVDASWLYPGKSNPATAGGWGAVISETYANGRHDTWTPSGPTPDHVTNNSSAETYAALAALKAVKIREEYRPGTFILPPIVLHGDQKNWAVFIERERKNPQRTPKGPHEVILKEMVQLLQEMNGTFEYTSHHKQNTGMQIPDKHTDDPLMSVPHDLARQAAWKQRLEKQGELHLGLGKVAPKPGEDDESFVRRLFPVDKALHYGIKR